MHVGVQRRNRRDELLGLLIGRLGLTGAKGNPLCAAVRPPVIQWSAEAAPASPGL
jgi:hypothetical protein